MSSSPDVFSCQSAQEILRYPLADDGLAATQLTSQSNATQQDLADFLYAYASYGGGVLEYDSADPGKTSTSQDILDKMIGNDHWVCVDYSIYPVIQPQDSYLSKSMGSDPRGELASYKHYEAETVEWVARNIFNVSDSYIAKRKLEGGTVLNGQKWYYQDGTYYAGLAGVGGPQQYSVDVASCARNSRGTYDVEYDLVTSYPVSGSATRTDAERRYAEFKLITQDGAEYWSLLRHSASPLGQASSVSVPTTWRMYRLYNPNSGEHFYTADAVERSGVVDAGWTDEGTGWTAPATSNTPVFRMYNPNAGEHHYCTDEGERDMLVGAGWYSDDAKAVPLYRDYNPNAFANNHNYTTSREEHEYLVSLGWRDEGFAWYGV